MMCTKDNGIPFNYEVFSKDPSKWALKSRDGKYTYKFITWYAAHPLPLLLSNSSLACSVELYKDGRFASHCDNSDDVLMYPKKTKHTKWYGIYHDANTVLHYSTSLCDASATAQYLLNSLCDLRGRVAVGVFSVEFED